jgi:hypothetical protein
MAESEHDPKVSQRYRELGREEPPPELDAAILAASRRAGELHPAPLVAPTGRLRWYFPLAAAAIIVLAVAVTLHVERQQPDPETPLAIPEPSVKEESKAAPKAARAQKPAAPAFTPEPPPQPVEAPRSAPAADAAREVAPATQGSAGAPAARSEMRAARVVAQAESPERALERIAELRRQGRHDEADQALAEFRKRYPDYKIPGTMLQKVEKR